MNGPGGAGVPGASYQTQITTADDTGSQFDHLYTDAGSGQSVPIHVGDGYAPRHVVLVTGVSGNDITVYDPSSGQVVTVTRQQFSSSTFRLGGRQQAWLATVPR
jgi:hypothetical protein